MSKKLGKKTDFVTTNPPTLEELKEMGLPKKAVLCGFTVHHPKRDEFLAKWNSLADIEQWAWAKIPDFALKYPDPTQAEVASKAYDGGQETIVCAVFDIGKQHVIWGM